MLILKSYKFFEYFIALGALQDIAQAARAAFISCSISLSLLFVFIHILMNLSNFTVVIESICVISGYMSLFPIYLHMIFNRDRFAMLSNDLNNTVNESKLEMLRSNSKYTSFSFCRNPNETRWSFVHRNRGEVYIFHENGHLCPSFHERNESDSTHLGCVSLVHGNLYTRLVVYRL